MPSVEIDELTKMLTKFQQEHLLKFWPILSAEERMHLVNDIKSIDFDAVRSTFEVVKNMDQTDKSKKLDDLLEPLPEDLQGGVSRCSIEQIDEYRQEGLRQISENKVAVLLLAGGQGTRLGVNYPKGMYDVGLPSHKTLYQLQAERILKIQQLAYDSTGKKGYIPWYIMTSEHTMNATLNFFDDNNYFGLDRENVVVFEQCMLPCLTFTGKIILESPYKIAKAPDGNGGLFNALQEKDILYDLKMRGIQYVHVYCVDNILVKMADPVFIGFCIKKNAKCGAKVVEKVSPQEAVGVVCRVDGKFQVVEYSEISLETANKRNPDGKLSFNAGNICNHFFTVDFLSDIGISERKLKHHVAKKKIPYVSEDGQLIIPLKANGIKLEKFVFDVFVFSDSFVAWDVPRNEEFSPLKNADSADKDTPTTARESLYLLHRHFIENASGKFSERDENQNDNEKNSVGICEISPLVSYGGEGLENIVMGKVFKFPLSVVSANEDVPTHFTERS